MPTENSTPSNPPDITLEQDRVYVNKSHGKGSFSYAIIRYIGAEHVVYHYYTDSEALIENRDYGECVVKLDVFKKSYEPISFIYDTGIV